MLIRNKIMNEYEYYDRNEYIKNTGSLGYMQYKHMHKLSDMQTVQLENAERELRRTQRVFASLMILFGTIAVWKYVRERAMRQRYGELIDMIDEHVANGKYTGPRGMETAWAFEYGRLGAFMNGVKNPNLPAALVYGFYNKSTHDTFVGQDKGLSSMQSILRLANTTRLNSLQLMCQGLYPDADPSNLPSTCQRECDVQDIQTTEQITSDLLVNTTMGASSGLALGSMMGGATGTLVFLTSTAMSVYDATSSILQKDKMCQKSLEGCYNPDNIQCHI